MWRMKFRFDGKEKMLSFGSYPDLSLLLRRRPRCYRYLLAVIN
ncbi:hypothetical protein ACLN6N_02755 [Sphingomonas carotinifaciens]